MLHAEFLRKEGTRTYVHITKGEKIEFVNDLRKATSFTLEQRATDLDGISPAQFSHNKNFLGYKNGKLFLTNNQNSSGTLWNAPVHYLYMNSYRSADTSGPTLVAEKEYLLLRPGKKTLYIRIRLDNRIGYTDNYTLAATATINDDEPETAGSGISVWVGNKQLIHDRGALQLSDDPKAPNRIWHRKTDNIDILFNGPYEIELIPKE